MVQVVAELSRKKEVKRTKIVRETRQVQSSPSSIENRVLDIQFGRVENQISDVVADQLIDRQEADKKRLSNLKHDLETKLPMLNQRKTRDTLLDACATMDMNGLIRTFISRIQLNLR